MENIPDGLDHKTGTIRCDENNDYALKFFNDLPWAERSTPKVSPRDNPWLRPESVIGESWNSMSFAMKYMNYETEPRYIDLSNPFIVQEFNEIRKTERVFKKRKRNDNEDDGDREPEQDRELEFEKKFIEKIENKGFEDDDDDFLDEYGNVKEISSKTENSLPDEKSNVKPKNPPKPKKSLNLNRQTVWRDLDSTEKSGKNPFSERHLDKTLTAMASFVEHPRDSFLNRDEQRNYLELYKRFWNSTTTGFNMSKKDRNDFELFQSYLDVVKSEQTEYLEFAKSAWEESDRKSLLQLSDDARKFLNLHFKNCIDDVLPRVSECYHPLNSEFIRLSPEINSDDTKPEYEMILERNCLDLGVIPKINIPSFESLTSTANRCKITTDFEKLSAKTKQRFPIISADPNADILVQNLVPDIVISSKTIQTIFNNFEPRFEKVWEIPITVKVVKDGRKSVFFDKPLPPNGPLTVLEKNVLFTKLSGKSFLVHPWTVHKQQIPSTPSTLEDDRFIDFEEDGTLDHTSLETFGVHSQLDGNVDGSSEDDDDKKLVIDDPIHHQRRSARLASKDDQKMDIDLGNILKSQNAILSKMDSQKRLEKGTKMTTSTHSSQQYKGEDIDRTEIGVVSDFIKSSTGNLTYKLWTLRPRINRSGDENIKVLIRSSIHGIRPTTKNNKTKLPEIMTLAVKLENQWNLGPETATKGEKAKAWISTFIRPNSSLCRLRVQNPSHEIGVCEIKTLPELTRDCANDFKPAHLLGNLYSVFQGVRHLEAGRYLLQHDSNSGPFLRVFQASNPGKAGNYNLRETYSSLDWNLDKPIGNVQWIPLDFNIIVPWHKKNNRVPGLFRPAVATDKGRGRGRARGKLQKKHLSHKWPVGHGKSNGGK